MNSLFRLKGITLLISIIIGSIIVNIILVGFVALVAKLRWGKKGNLGITGPTGFRGHSGEIGDIGIKGKPGTIVGMKGDQGEMGNFGKIPNGEICKPFSRAENNNHECKDSVLRGWTQIDWFENQDKYPNNVACVPSRLSNKGESSVVAFFGGPDKPDVSSNDCSTGSCYVGNNAYSVNEWIKNKKLPSNVRLQPGNDVERNSGRCIAGDSQMTGEESAVLTNVQSSNSGTVDTDTGLPIDNSGSDISAQNEENPVLTASPGEGTMYDLENQPGGGYAEGEDSDPSVIIGTREEFFNNTESPYSTFTPSPQSSNTDSNLKTTRFGKGIQREPTECTAHKLDRLWGKPEKQIGTTGNSCTSSDDCKNNDYSCVNNKCNQVCVRDNQAVDANGRCLCKDDNDCKPGLNCSKDPNSNKNEGYCEEASDNIWKCSKVNDKCGPYGTNWSDFGKSDKWKKSANSTFICLDRPNLEKGCTKTPCWHKIRTINENTVGSQNIIVDSSGKISKEQGLWSSDKDIENYPSNPNDIYPYEEDGALIPCNDNPDFNIDRCQANENTDWIKGTSKITSNRWAGHKTKIAKNTKGRITDYMKIGTKDLVVADPFSIKDARKKQCSDWLAYYNGRNSILIGEDDLNSVANGNTMDTVSKNNGIQPFYPGMCKPVPKEGVNINGVNINSCVASNRTVNDSRDGGAPAAPKESRKIGLRHYKFKTSPNGGQKYSMPADKTSGIFKTCRCDSGHFSPNGDLSADCEQCPAGTFLSEKMAKKGFTYCLDCPPGTYQDETGKSGCKPCPAGTFQDEWGQTQCKGCKCGFKCPPVESSLTYDSSKQISNSLKIDDVNFKLGRKYPVPCVSGEYCPGIKNPDKPHNYPYNDQTANACLGCETNVSKSSEYCKSKGACADCPCPKGNFCPDNSEIPADTPILPDHQTCNCESGHTYSLNLINSLPTVSLIGDSGLSKSKNLTGVGHEARCCKEGQCCDISVDSCIGSGRKNKENGSGLGFIWPVKSPQNYESYCFDHDSTIRPYNSEERDTDVYGCNYQNCDSFTQKTKVCSTGEIVSRNKEDCCNFEPCDPFFQAATQTPA